MYLVIMGATKYEEAKPARTPLGVGRDCHIKRAIIDLDTRIGDGSQLINSDGVQQADAENYCIRDGIIVVPRGAEIPPGTVI